MGRLVLAGLLCVTSVGVATAGPTRKVDIDTTPPGATVYIDSIEDGVACTPTPCQIDAPIGTPTIIIRLDKYEPSIEPFPVEKGKRPLRASFKLKSAIGTYVIEQKGVSVEIDKEDKGTVGSVPLRIDLSAELHSVVITQNGKTLYDEIVGVDTGEEKTIGPKSEGWKGGGTTTTVVARGGGDDGGDGDGSDDGDTGGGGGGGESGGVDSGISGSAAPVDRGHYLTASAAFDVAFRHFTYDQAMTANLREESEDGQVLLGPVIELWPMRLAGSTHLRHLSLLARAEFGIHSQQLTGANIMGTVTTLWTSFEGSLRNRWMFGSAGVEAGGGYVQDQMQFNVTNGNDINQVPDALYRSLRLGGKLLLVNGPLEVYLSGENRIVLSGGTQMEKRFNSAKATGLRGALGLAYTMGPIFARFEASLMHYSWTFTSDTSMSKADGATDSVKMISFVVGYAK